MLPDFDYGFSQAAGSSLIGSGNRVFLWWVGWAGSAFNAGDLVNSGVIMAFFLYMVAFMDTTPTIPTGSMAERWKFKSFIIWGLFCGAIFHPLFGAWTWGGGWLAKLGNSLEWGNGHVDVRLQRSADRSDRGHTAIVAAFGGFTPMLWIWKRTTKPDPAMMANGMLAGLVIIVEIQNALTKGGIRSDQGEEETGLDLPEMGVLACPDLSGAHEGYSDGGSVLTAPPEA